MTLNPLCDNSFCLSLPSASFDPETQKEKTLSVDSSLAAFIPFSSCLHFTFNVVDLFLQVVKKSFESTVVMNFEGVVVFWF